MALCLLSDLCIPLVPPGWLSCQSLCRAPSVYWAPCKSVQGSVPARCGREQAYRWMVDSLRTLEGNIQRDFLEVEVPQTHPRRLAICLQRRLPNCCLLRGPMAARLRILPCLMTGDQWLVLPPWGEPGPDQAPEGGPAASTAPQKRYVLPILTLSGHTFPARLLPQSKQSPHSEAYMRLLSSLKSTL